MPQLHVDAVLFDLDGTLVDSTASVERNWARLADRLGRPFAELEPLIHGIPAAQVLRMLDPAMPEDEIAGHAQFLQDGESTDTGDVLAQPGALTMLDGLPTSRWAIVTSGSLRLATARMTAAAIPRPRVLVTADDVAIGKPAPDPYLAGARAIGFPPERCLVLEDAPAGVASAQAAGCPVIGILTTHRELPGPTVPSLADIELSPDRTGVIVTY